ncbi:hypothetical protein BDV28DRAFT_137957 [Aspergillus coremiiformis]|uniref:Uncharacterized protein n=1 Tax=Aspergillus coremiiformis TaxID=138285 RepID=A0A5N6Z051_9EURO|nr:hypothetical protein BDV28DRAFT_137957 [Aspergillus coremiiformis]
MLSFTQSRHMFMSQMTCLSFGHSLQFPLFLTTSHTVSTNLVVIHHSNHTKMSITQSYLLSYHNHRIPLLLPFLPLNRLCSQIIFRMVNT